MSARIPLRARDGSVRAYALVDEADFEYWGGLRWSLRGDGYAVRQIDGCQQALHRVLLGLAPGDPRETDHINRDRLDNRRANLRIVTRAQNAQNLSPHPGASAHRGVSWDSKHGKWLAGVKLNRRQHFLGFFENEEDAARVAAQFRAQHMPYSEEARAT